MTGVLVIVFLIAVATILAAIGDKNVAAWDNPRNDSPAVEDTHAATHQPPPG